MTPVTLDLVARRWAPFVEVPFGFEAFDFSAATFEMQVRTLRDLTGDPLIDLTNATAGTEGISCEVTTTDGVDTSFLTVQIDEATLNDLPFAGKRGQNFVGYYDLKITGGGLPKTRWFQGKFTCEAGVTQ